MTREEIIQPENLVYGKNPLINDTPLHYCPGCSHGVVHKLVAEVIDELGLREDTIGISSSGCSVFIYDFLDIDYLEAPHGRAMAVATGAKRAKPDKFVFSYPT